MTRNKALAFVALAAIGCGGGRSLLLLPLADDGTRNNASAGPDAAHDVLPDPPLPDVAPALPDVGPDVGQEDARPPQPDGPPIRPDVWLGPDTVEVRPLPNDAGPDTLSPPSDARLDLLPLPIDMRLDLLPPPIDLRPDVLPPAPDLRPYTPDTPPPLQTCASGAACSSDCKTTCQVIGTSTCTCSNGTLSCGACQTPRVVFTPAPCPDNAAGTTCDTNGIACPVYRNGTVTGLCACLDLGAGTRWNCL